MIHDNISFKISVSRHYHQETEVVLLFLAAVIFVSIFTNLFLLLIISGILSTILLVINAFAPMRKSQKRFVFITFKPTWIEIGKEISIKINYIDIQKVIQQVILHYSNTKGEQAKVMTMTGRDNTIKIITKNGEKITKNIWCENDTDYRRLKSLGNFLEEKGINVKMKGFERE